MQRQAFPRDKEAGARSGLALIEGDCSPEDQKIDGVVVYRQ